MDKSAFTRLILANEQQLYRIAKSILKKDEDCADAAQEAIAAGFASLHTLRDDRYAKTWLIRILINQCYRILRENSRHLPWRNTPTEFHRPRRRHILICIRRF